MINRFQYRYIQSGQEEFNHLPGPRVEYPRPDDFHKALVQEPLAETEECQVYYPGDEQGKGGLFMCRIFYFSRFAWALLMDKNEAMFWRIGCKHDHVAEIKVGNCRTKYVCPDCGLIWVWDSSD